MAAVPYLLRELQELSVSPPVGFRVEPLNDIHEWIVWFVGPDESPYAGGCYRAILHFPDDFPMNPPQFRITSSFWHPNVYANGQFCISILHPPGVDDLNTEESALMRWTPVRTISSVLLSIMSLLYDPDPQDSGAPANVDALSQFRRDREGFNRKCAEFAKKSLEALPPNFVVPSMKETKPVSVEKEGNLFNCNEEDNFEEDEINTEFVKPSERHYLEELQQLRDMEFAMDMSDDDLLAILAKHRGEVASVILELCE